jgi:hypothetical protein
MQIPVNRPIFEIVCKVCDGLGINFECAENSPSSTPIKCRHCALTFSSLRNDPPPATKQRRADRGKVGRIDSEIPAATPAVELSDASSWDDSLWSTFDHEIAQQLSLQFCQTCKRYRC